MVRNHFSNILFPQPKEAPYEIWANLAQQFQRSHLKMLTDAWTHGRTDGWTVDGQKMIPLAHPEHSSGELETEQWYFEGWAQDYGNSNVFLKPLFRGNLDPFVNNANLGAIAHTSNGT